MRDRVLSEGVFAFSHGAADVGFGLVLIVSASAIADGSFTVGTLALFAAYLGWLSFLPRMVGRLLARRKQAGVAFERMRMLVAETDVNNTVRERYLPIERWQQGVRPDAVRPPRVPLQRFEVVGLSARYPDGSGVGPVSFAVDRGSFTVVTGPVGCGQVDAAAGDARARVASRRVTGWCAGTACRSTIPAPSSCRRTRRSCRRCPSSCPTR